MDIEKTHLKALLRNRQMRQAICHCIDNEKLKAVDVDDLTNSKLAALHVAAWEVFNDEAPKVKSFRAEGGDGEEYPINIVGVKGAYAVCAPEFDDKGVFETVEEAEEYVGLNWLGEAREA